MADPNPFLAFQEKLLQSPKPLTGEAPIEGVPAATTEAAAPDNPFAAFQAKLLQQPAAPAKSGAAQKPATTETPAAPAEAPPNPFAAFQAKLLRQPSAPGEATAPGMTPETLNEPATLADRFTQAWTAPGEGVVGHTWGVLNTPLVAEADIEGWLGNPKEQFGTLFGGIAKGAYELVSGLTSPLSLAFVIGSMGAGALFESGGAAMLKNVGKMAATDIEEVVKGSRILAKAAQLGKTSDEALVAMEASGVNTKVVMDGLDTLKKAGMTSHDLVRGGLVHTAGSAALRGLNMPIKTADSIAKSIQMMIEGGFAAQNVYGAVTAFPSALDAIKEGDVGKAAELITTAAGMAGFGLLGTHALMKEAGGGIDPVLAKMGLHTKPTDENIKLSREWGVHDRQVLERGRAHELWSEALRKDPEFQKILKEGDLHAIFNYVQAGGDPDVMAARRRLVQMSAGREPDVAPENALLAFQADLPDAPRTRRNQPTVNAADPDKVALLDPEAYLGGAISTPFSTYHEASQVKADRNAYVRDAKTPDNTGRALKVQFSSNLINKIVTDTLELEHRTDQPDLTVTDPSKYGTGVPGAEAKRQAAFPEFWVDRTYFTKKDVPVEALMAKLKFTYGAKVPEGLIYDPKVDPKGYFGKAREILAAKGYTPTTNAILTLGEKLMAEGGEGGFAIGDNVALFGPTEVFKKSLSPEELATQYNNKLYAETRPGFARPADFWEVPQWIANASHFLPDSDMYVVRNMEEAKKFLGEAKYDRVLFSALDVNKHLVKELAESYGGRIDAGGYIDPAYFQGNPNIHWHDSMESLARDMGVPYKEGVDYRHFKGSDAILRLNMSKGCLHKCAFCIANSPLELTSKEAIDQQVGEIVKMGAKLVYLNDKTFGQAKNYQYLSELNDRIKKQNPGFHGFVVQTTAAQLGKIPAEWLAKSGIRYVELGVESFNDPLLKEMHKPATEMLINKAVDKLRKNKIALIPNILIGYPGETAETYARTLDFLKHNKDIISHANIFNLALYADAELGKKMTTAAEGDFNENVLEKSWHKDPNIVKTFAGELYGYASNQLDQLPDVLRDLRPLNELTEVEKKHLAVGQRNEVFRNVLLRDPGVKDLIAAAKMGSAGRDWYERSIQAFEAMRELAPRYFRPEDADVWAGVVASISPQQSVQLNLRESIDFWKDWVDNGRPKTEEQILKLQRKGKMRHLANQPSKLPNVIRSLNGEDLLPESREQYFKVGNFANALRKYFSGAEKTVFDSWMGVFFGLNETQVGSASFYHAMAVQTRLAARELGWKPEQVQAAVWSFTKTLGEMSGWKSPEFGEYYKPADVLGHMTPEDVAVYSKDFSNLMYSDREIRGRLMQLGVNLNELDKRLKGIPKPAPIEGAVEAGLTESVRRSAERIGKAQQQLVGFDKYSKYQPGTEFDFSKEIESAKPKTETPPEDWVSPKVPFAVSRMEKLGTIVDRVPNARGNDTAAGLFKNQRGEYLLALSRDQLANFNRITESPRTPKGVLDVARGLSTSTDPTVLNALRNLLLKDADPATVQLGEMLKAAGNNPLAIIKLTGSGPFNTMLYEYVHSELFNTLLHEHVHGVLSDQEAAVVMTKIRHMDGLEQLKNHIRGIEYKGARYSESEVPGELMTRMVAGQLYNVMGVAPEKVDAILWEALNVLPSETAYQKILGNLESGVRNRIYEYIQPEGEGRGVRPELAGEPAGAGEARPGLGAPRAERGPGGVLKRDVTGTPEQQKRADLEKWIRTKAAGYQKEGFLGKTEESALKRVSEDVRAGRIPTELADAAMRYLKPARDPETMEVIDRDHPDFPRTAHIANFLEEQFQRRIPEGNVPGTPEEAGFQKEISDKPNVIDEDVKKVTAGIPGWGDSSANYWMTPEGRIVQVTDHSRSARSVFNSYYDDLHRAGYLRFFTTTDQDVIMSLQRGVDRHVIDKVLPKLDFKPRDFQVDEISPEEGVRPYTFHSEAELKNWMNRSQLPGLDFAKTLQGVNIAKGFTVNPHTGMIPKTGYSLEVVPEWRKTLDHDVTPADISKFAQKNRALLEANPHLFIGGWGRRELNISAVFKDLEDAKAAAKRLDQHGAWDIAKGEDIDVGGKGKQTEFPDYPIPERMAFTKKTSIPLTEAGPLKFNRDLSSGQEGTSDARLQELASRKLIKEKYTEKEIDDLIKAYDPAQLTQAHKNLASKIAVHFRDTLERAQKSGALEEGLEHYVTHMWQKDADNPAANRLLAEARSGRFAVSTSMARHRVFDHAIEGQLLGRKLAVTDPIALAAHNGNTFDRVISARDTLARLRDKGLRASDGRPMVALSGTGHIVQGDDGENPAVIIHPDRMSSIRIADKVIDGLRGTGELDRLIAEQKIVKYGDVKPTAEGGTGVQHYAWATNDYKSVSHPAFEGWKVPTEDTNGNPIILRSDLKVHPDAYDYMKRQLDTKSPLAEALKPAFIAGREAKGILLSFDVFHLVQEGLRAVMTGVSPFGVEKWDLRTNPLLGKLVEHGLTMKDYGAIDSFQEGQLVGHSHLMTKIPGIGPANAWFQDFLFKKYIPGLKARAAEHLFERYKKLYPEYPEEKILQLAATDTNMRFGGLNLRREGRALATQDVFRLVALAPDWLESEIRSMGRAMGGDGRVMRRDLAKVSVGLWLAARVLNQLNTGNAHYEAPFGVAYKDDNGREKVVSLRTLPTDILHAVTDPLKFMRYRTSPLERTLSTVYSGRDEMGRRLPARDLVWDVLGDSVVPLPLQNVVKKMSGFSPEQNWKDLSYRAMGGQVTTFKTEAQKKAAELAADRSESGPIDKDKLREHVARIEVEDNMRSGQSKSEDLFQMVDQGLMSPKDAKVIMKNVQDTRGMDSDLARLYTRASRLPMSDFLDVWELATAGEKSTLTKLLLKKKATYFKKAYTDLSAQQRSTDTTYRRLRQLFPDSAPF